MKLFLSWLTGCVQKKTKPLVTICPYGKGGQPVDIEALKKMDFLVYDQNVEFEQDDKNISG